MLRMLLILVLCLAPAFGERVFPIDGPMELHIWLTAKSGEEAALEKTFREVFYPAVSAREGFRDARLMRKPGTLEYTVRLTFDTEDERMAWVASDEHQKAWPVLSGHCSETKYDGFALIHPK